MDDLDLESSSSSLNFSKLFSSVGTAPPHFTYFGSQTMPPCAEVVNWYILTNVQRISTINLSKFHSKYQHNLNFNDGKGNNRPL
jgi:carbonic anhydrase